MRLTLLGTGCPVAHPRRAGRTAVISGDTTPSERLIAAGRGADFLVHEVFLHRDMTPLPGRREPATVAAVASYHTLSGEVGGVARAMGARVLALTHFVPPDFDRGALLAEVGESYGGPVFIGEDLMWFDLARREVGRADPAMGSGTGSRPGCPEAPSGGGSPAPGRPGGTRGHLSGRHL